jgi:hypothetical protein
MKRQTHRIANLLAVMTGIMACAVHAETESAVTLSSGVDYSSGKYGAASTTDILSVPVNAIYETGAWSLKLTVPYLSVTGDGEVIAGGRYGRGRGMMATTTTTTTVTTTRTTQSGLGDVATMLTYNMYSGENYESGIDLSGRVKFGTASKALGTGQNDYAVQIFMYRDVGDISPNLLLGYEMLGSSVQLPLNNVFYGIAGSSYRISDGLHIGAEYKYGQKASDTLAEQRQATLYANLQIAADVYLRGYVLKGYAAGSPDSGYGMLLSVTY